MHIENDHKGLNISRRIFLHSGSLTAAVVPALASWDLAAIAADLPASHSFKPDTNLLRCAESAAQWIQSAQKHDERGGIWWLPDPDHPDKLTTVSPPNTLYSGSTGNVLFFIQLAHATGNTKYLETASLGADYLAATWRDLVDKPFQGLISVPGLNLTLYEGLAGLAFVLQETGKATKNAKYSEIAKTATDYIAQAAKPTGAGVAWSDAPGIAGDGSIVLYLLYAVQEFQDERYRSIAQQAGDRILELAVKDPRGGLRWQGSPAFPGMPKDIYFPNFEAGTAGVAYVLTRLYSETKKDKYLAAAKLGALHLQIIAAVHGNAALIPYRFPDLPNLYYLGFCHGPAGTARTFFELHRITGEPEYQIWTERLAQGVIQSGVPENLTPGYWNVCQCCGSAAIIELFFGLWASTGRAGYLAFAQRVARQLESHATDFDGKGDRWYQAWTRIKPSEVNAETGYTIGAAGIAAALLHVHLAEQGKYTAIVLPDNPFPRTRVV